MRAEMMELVRAINEDSRSGKLAVSEDDYSRLEGILERHPDCWPTGLADMFLALLRRLRWEEVDRKLVPEALRGFYDEKYRRDLDPMALARHIGQDLCSSCADCGCRC